MEAKPVEVNDAIFEKEVLQSEVPVVVDYWAPWCAPCKASAPILDAIAKEYQGKAKICKINIVDGQQTATRYGVMSVPTVHIYKDGQVVDQVVGVPPHYESEIKKKLQPYITQ